MIAVMSLRRVNPNSTHLSRRLVSLLLVLPAMMSVSANGQDYGHTFVNGTTHAIHSTVLEAELTLFVYLPGDYKESKNAYPVHYVLDAPGNSNLFYDLLRMHSFVKAMPAGIVVGVASVDREYDLHPEQGAEKFLSYLTTEVIPFIEANYRTDSFRSIAGHSLGGGFAIYAFLKRPSLFTACIAGSPYPLLVLAKIVENDLPGPMPVEKRILFSSIGAEDDIPQTDFEHFQKALSDRGSERLEYHFQMNAGENHISNVALNYQDGLEALYEEWMFTLPETLETPIDSLLARHYQRLSDRLGYSVRISQWDVLFPVMDQLAKRGDFASAIVLLEYCIQLYPKSDQAYAFLGRAYLSIGNPEASRASLEKSLELNPDNEYARTVMAMLGS